MALLIAPTALRTALVTMPPAFARRFLAQAGHVEFVRVKDRKVMALAWIVVGRMSERSGQTQHLGGRWPKAFEMVLIFP
jgi:hypothetical protein